MLVPILITCTQFALTGDSGTFVKAMAAPVVGSESQPVGLILENNTDADADLALALFRNSLTRGIVVDFYNSITRSAEITQAVLEAATEYSIPPSLALPTLSLSAALDAWHHDDIYS